MISGKKISEISISQSESIIGFNNYKMYMYKKFRDGTKMTNNVEDQPSNISASFVLYDPVVISEEELICEV